MTVIKEMRGEDVSTVESSDLFKTRTFPLIGGQIKGKKHDICSVSLKETSNKLQSKA